MKWANVSVWDTATLIVGWILSLLTMGCEIVIPYLTSQIVLIILDRGRYEQIEQTRNEKRKQDENAISKAQKAQNIFFEKNFFRSFRNFVPFGKCRIVPKNVKGGPFGIY